MKRLNEIKRALISVTDKKGIVEFARALSEFGVEILSTGGTAAMLQKNGVKVMEVSNYTGFPEMMDGRLKTLHPKIHGGLLAIRDEESHMASAKKEQIPMIDMVVVNLYRFENTVAREGCTLEDAIENIDIGGPTMLRAGAKNHHYVTVVTDPDDYPRIINEMKERGGKISSDTNFALAAKTFQLTARYDAAVSNYLGAVSLVEDKTKIFPDTFTVQFKKSQDLRYGENPHQNAAFFKETDALLSSLANARQLQGKELSYNNIMDGDAAWRMVSDFDLPAAVIMKHANPCGAATSSDICNAYLKALKTDPVSAFGGIVALNRPVDKKAAEELAKIFFEIIIAPGFKAEALKILSIKANLRVLEIPPSCTKKVAGYDMRRVMGGLLVQNWDTEDFDIRKAKVVTKRPPTEEEYQALDFAWRVVKHVKSNAIVYAVKDQLVGVGAGQMSRVDSVRIARMKANMPTKGCVVASDAFFPFRDGVDLAAEAGITAVVQPGESLRDAEVIKAADEHGMAMIFTGTRHFKH
jgi:phosphoribosylaminoimidazolecarboxamide formyltransferase/IMP cyclohydrolase